MKKYDLMSSIVLFILGVVLLVIPGNIVTTILRIFGIIIIALGILSIVNSSKDKSNSTELVYGILMSILGLVFVSNPQVIAGIIPFILGVWIVIKSLFKLQIVSTLKRTNTDYIKPLVINVITLIIGIVLMFNPFKGAETFIMIIGIFMIVYSSLDFLNYFFTKPKKVKVLK